MLPAGTEVVTTKGPVDVRGLSGSEELQVLTGPGELGFRKLKRIWYREPAGEIACFQTSSGARFCTSLDQPFCIGLDSRVQPHDLFLVKRSGLGFFLALGHGTLRENPETRIIFHRSKESATEAVWLLGSYATHDEAQYNQQLTSCRHGLPVLPRTGRPGERGLPDELFRRLLIEVNTFVRGRRLLNETGMSETLPFWLVRRLPRPRMEGRRLMDIVAFASGSSHVVTLHPMGGSGRVEGRRLRHMAARRAAAESFESLDELVSGTEEQRSDKHVDVQVRVRATAGKPLFVMPAAYAREGMRVACLNAEGLTDERLQRITRERFQGAIYGLALEEDLPLVANGLVLGSATLAGLLPPPRDPPASQEEDSPAGEAPGEDSPGSEGPTSAA